MIYENKTMETHLFSLD